MEEISIKVPARICFFGDHQDYLGLPVIAGTINRYIKLTARPILENEFQINLIDLKTSKSIKFDDTLRSVEQDDYFRSGMSVLKKEGFQYTKGYEINISGNIPLNAGLSSSSALVVAWVRFLIAIQDGMQVSDEKIGEWAYEAEVEFFDQPGGLMDQYTIAQKGLLYINTKTGLSTRLSNSLGSLVVAESGIEKKTRKVLRNGRLFQEKAIAEVKVSHPKFDILTSEIADYKRYLGVVSEKYRKHWYAAIHNYSITKRAKQLLLSEDIDVMALGDLMREHQNILQNCIQNTPFKMTIMMNAAIGAGALGAKTIGSGGGGCMVAMVTAESKKNVIDAFLTHGAKTAYEVELV